MRKLLILPLLAVLALALGACGFTPQGDAVRQAISIEGAKAMDQGLVNTEWFMCNGASVGSVRRRYGKSKDTAEAWRTLCGDNPDARIVTPEDSSTAAPADSGG